METTDMRSVYSVIAKEIIEFVNKLTPEQLAFLVDSVEECPDA